MVFCFIFELFVYFFLDYFDVDFISTYFFLKIYLFFFYYWLPPFNIQLISRALDDLCEAFANYVRGSSKLAAR